MKLPLFVPFRLYVLLSILYILVSKVYDDRYNYISILHISVWYNMETEERSQITDEDLERFYPGFFSSAKRQKEYELAKQKMFEFCFALESNVFTPTRILYDKYESWCLQNGLQIETIRKFSLYLQSKGIKKSRGFSDGTQYQGFKGIKIRR